MYGASAVDTVEKTCNTLDQTVHDLKECLKRIKTLEEKVSRKRLRTSDEEEGGYSYIYDLIFPQNGG